MCLVLFLINGPSKEKLYKLYFVHNIGRGMGAGGAASLLLLIGGGDPGQVAAAQAGGAALSACVRPEAWKRQG